MDITFYIRNSPKNSRIPGVDKVIGLVNPVGKHGALLVPPYIPLEEPLHRVIRLTTLVEE